jgi:hypothetical protein
MRIGTAIISALLLFLSGQSHGQVHKEWVSQSLQSGDRLLCNTERGGEQFFVALNDQRVKLGSLLDLSNYTDSHAVIAGWTVRDENDAQLIAQVVPESVKSGSVTKDGKTFSETIEYQTLRARPRVLRASMTVKKCPSLKCERREKLDSREIEYTVEVCRVQLGP